MPRYNRIVLCDVFNQYLASYLIIDNIITNNRYEGSFSELSFSLIYTSAVDVCKTTPAD